MIKPEKPQISPSILTANFQILGSEIKSLESVNCPVLHLDVMDGVYVPNISFGPMVVKAIRALTDMELEAHLMIKDPEPYLEPFMKAGSDTILVHPSTCKDVSHVLQSIHDLGGKAGLVVNPDESLQITEPYLDTIEQILIMSVYPGFGGQKFIPDVLQELPDFIQRLEGRDILIEIDGGINSSTLPALIDHGIHRFVAGSAVFNTKASPAENYLNLISIFP